MDRRNDTYGDATYGDRIADVYDDWYAGSPILGDLVATVDLLASLAGEGPALELGIGTGRVALPLAATGVEIHGIDVSQAMVARLREKPGGDRIPVTMGSFADFALADRFALIYVVFNTFFGLRSQEQQIACLRAVVGHLRPGGAFAMEAFVPDPARFDRGQRMSAIRVEEDEVSFEVSKHDLVAQSTTTQHVVIREDGIRLHPVQIRYAHVAELDLMARLAGLRLRERWADWDRSTFSSSAEKHISVWEREDTTG